MCLVVIVLFLLAIGFLVFKNRYRKGPQSSLHGGGGGDEEEGLMKSTIDTTINEPGKCVRAGTGRGPREEDEMRRKSTIDPVSPNFFMESTHDLDSVCSIKT